MHASTQLTTNTTPTYTKEASLAQGALVVFQVINGVLIFCASWILVCLVVYGTKMNRWRKSSGTSSLNSGVIYTTCVAIVVLAIPRLIMDAVMFNMPAIPNALQKCELILDLSTGANCIITYSKYFFLWLRQKVTYDHPSVREIAGKCVSVFSWVTLVGFTLLSIGIGCLYILPLSYQETAIGCVLKPLSIQTAEEIFLDSIGQYAFAGAIVLLQVTLLCLFIYPMSLSHAEWMKTDETKQLKVNKNVATSKASQIKEETTSFLSFCKRVIVGHPASKTSPVARTIHRSLIFCAIIIFSDILTIIVVSVMPRDVLRPIPYTIYDISTLVSILCALATFGDSGRVLTSVCMPCAQNIKSETPKESRITERKESNASMDSEASEPFQDKSPFYASEPEWV